MSLILEALKKSESERRLGELPGLMTPAGSRHGRHSNGWPILLAVLLLICVILSGLWWLLWRDPAAVDPAPGARDRLSPKPSAAVDGGPAGDVLQLEIQRRRAAAVAIPAVPGGADAGGQRAPQTVERESRPQQPSLLPPPPASLPEPDPAPHADSRSTATRPVDATPTTRDSQSAGNTRPVADDAVAGADAGSGGRRDATAGGSSNDGRSSLPSLRQLPASTRDRLPPLKVSMYVYNEGEASRFLLVDGHRVLEGGRIADGLVLVEVRRQDAVLEFEGQRFLLPRP